MLNYDLLNGLAGS